LDLLFEVLLVVRIAFGVLMIQKLFLLVSHELSHIFFLALVLRGVVTWKILRDLERDRLLGKLAVTGWNRYRILNLWLELGGI